MADEKISALPSAGALAGTEPVPIVQGGVTKQTTAQAIANLASPGGNASITPITVAALNTLRLASNISTTTFYNVTNAVGSTLVLQVYAFANNTNTPYAVNVATGEIGTYDITGDVFVSVQPYSTLPTAPTSAEDDTKGYKVGYTVRADDTSVEYICKDTTTGAAVWEFDTSQLIPFRVVANPAAIQAGNDIPIVECPSLPIGYVWKTVEAVAKVTGATVDYDGKPPVNIKALGASVQQFTDDAGILESGLNTSNYLQQFLDITISPVIVEWDGVPSSGIGSLVLSFDSTPSTTGDGTLTVYGTARIIKL